MDWLTWTFLGGSIFSWQKARKVDPPNLVYLKDFRLELKTPNTRVSKKEKVKVTSKNGSNPYLMWL